MNDWSKNRQKKELEARHLSYFLDSYFDATGEHLQLKKGCERPDFICAREDGTTVGIELTRIVRNPHDAQWEKILHSRQFMTLDEAIDRISSQTLKKDKKRSESDWKLSEQTILVLQLMDIPLGKLGTLLTPHVFPDLQGVEFIEVWMADFTTIEAFGGVDLYAYLHPELSGHQHLFRNMKPYG